MDEYKRLRTLAKNFGIETELLDPGETKSIFPLIDSSIIKGALYCQSDGVVDPSMFCKALTTAALQLGANVSTLQHTQ
jgi:4-methylaminobutanoate oxidase (formaldehyde-forming)